MILSKLASAARPLPKDISMIPRYLDNLTEMIFQNFQLWVNNESYRFSELEYYIFDPINHPDVFSHQHDIQCQFGHWYVHESGIDITFGDYNVYASVLIRGLRKDNSNERQRHISGPLNVLKTVCNSFQTIDSKKHDFYIQFSDKLVTTHWIKHKRIGLSIKKELEICKDYGIDSNADILFFDKLYRYIAWLEPYHSFKNKLRVMKDELKSGKDIKIIQNAFSYTPDFIKKSSK